eukprot:4821086-Lingulodinium_polyedra.AAC.1
MVPGARAARRARGGVSGVERCAATTRCGLHVLAQVFSSIALSSDESRVRCWCAFFATACCCAVAR